MYTYMYVRVFMRIHDSYELFGRVLCVAQRASMYKIGMCEARKQGGTEGESVYSHGVSIAGR
jgi:hypothetical protein